MSEHTEARLPMTKIIATIGPASESPEVIARLIEAGVAVFRFNFSHGDLSAHELRLRAVRAAAKSAGRIVACLGDLQGPKIRLGKVPPEGIDLEPGVDVLFRRGVETAFVEQGVPVLSFTYAPLIDEVLPGHKVLINDGQVRMLAVERDPGRGELRCRVVVGGRVTSHKGLNLPNSDISAPAITERDWECVEWAVANGLDFLALSFVRRAEEVLLLKERLASLCPVDRSMDVKGEGSLIPVIAKIEMPQALDDLERIAEAADGLMIARGDLGVEMDVAQVPVAQKRILEVAHDFGKPCIVATQMLETMIENAAPTRAEASDIANAIFDESDAVMLSGETAVGKHPALAVETMARVVHAAEGFMTSRPCMATPPSKVIAQQYSTAALAHGAWQIAADVGAKVIVCWSEHGGSARYLSQTGFRVPIVAYSSSERQTRRMALLFGVLPVRCDAPPSLADWNRLVDEHLLDTGLASRGDAIILLAGMPLGRAKVASTVALHRVGERGSGYLGL